jgi:hypothetical protein
MQEQGKQKNPVFFAIFVLAIAVTIPALTTGIFVDDYYHRMVMLDLFPSAQSSNDASLFGLFSFLDGNAERTINLIEQGVLPWWTLPEIKYTFFRPLSELSIYLDYQLWPNSFLLMHAQSSFWFALLALTCTAFFYFITPDKKIALLASLFFVLDGTHGLSIAWLAARNALLAAAFGMLSLYCLAKYLKFASLNYYLGSLLFLLASLAAGEIGLSTCAFIVVYVYFFGQVNLKEKIITALPFVILSLCWVMLRSYLDFGAYGSGAYRDPFQEPISFFINFLENINLVYFALWTGVPVEILSLLSSGKNIEAVLLFLCLNGFLLLLFLPFWINNKRAHFYLFAMLFASIPVSAGEIQSRVLIFVSIPALAFCAECLMGFWKARKDFVQQAAFGKVINRVWLTLLYIFSGLCLFAHLLVAPVILMKSQTLLADMINPILNQPVKSFQVSENFQEKVLVLVDPPLATAMGYFPVIRRVEGELNARNTYLLSSGLGGVSIKRIDDYTLELEPERGFLAEPMDRVMRSDKFLYQPGDIVSLSDVTITIVELNKKNYPQKVWFRFNEKLESDLYDFRCWNSHSDGGQLVHCQLPVAGEEKNSI